MKTKNTKKEETIVNFILDKSGSMSVVQESTISGFNEYVNTLKKDKKSDYIFTLTLFDTTYRKNPVLIPIEDVRDLDKDSYIPAGGTALYDAACTAIQEVGEKKGQKVLTIIMTDGEENSSKEYTQDHLHKLIKEKEALGNWTFVFLGANQDSYANAQKFGIAKMNTVNFVQSDKGMARSMSTLATNTMMYSASGQSNTSAFFSAADQSMLAKDDTINMNGSGPVDQKISEHFSDLGKKSWEARKKKIL